MTEMLAGSRANERAAPRARAPRACCCSSEFVRITGALATRHLSSSSTSTTVTSLSAHENAAMPPSTEGVLPCLCARVQKCARERAAFHRCRTITSCLFRIFAPFLLPSTVQCSAALSHCAAGEAVRARHPLAAAPAPASKKIHAGCPSGVLKCVVCSKKKRPCGAACAS